MQVSEQSEDTGAGSHELAPGDGPEQERARITDHQQSEQFRPAREDAQRVQHLAPVGEPPHQQPDRDGKRQSDTDAQRGASTGSAKQ